MLILVVDDDEFIRKLLSSYIRDQSEHQVLTAKNGREAFQYLETQQLDLVLLDVHLPDIKGFEILQEIRKKFSSLELPVMMVTSLEDSGNVIKGFTLGANEFITKPIDLPVAMVRMGNLLQTRAEYIKSNRHHNSRGPVRTRATKEDLPCEVPILLDIGNDLVQGQTRRIGRNHLWISLNESIPTREHYHIQFDHPAFPKDPIRFYHGLHSDFVLDKTLDTLQFRLLLRERPPWYDALFDELGKVFTAEGGGGIQNFLDQATTGLSQNDQREAKTIKGCRYTFQRHLGDGGFASVFLVKDLALRRFVAMKVLAPQYAANITARKNFLGEAQIVAQFHHPNIALVYEVGDLLPSERRAYLDFPAEVLEDYDHHFIFFTMQYIDGTNLADIICAREKISQSETVAILIEIARALQYAHNKGVIHRDIKPHNVLITSDQEVVVTDFGLAITDDLSEHATITEEIISNIGDNKMACTPYYASPQQLSGEPFDFRSDIYSFGVLAYEMLTGLRPFQGPNLVAVVKKHLYDAPPPLKPSVPDLHPDLEKLILQCLAKSPENRHAHAGLLLEDLREIQASFSAKPSSIKEKSLTELLNMAIYAEGEQESERTLRKLLALLTLHKNADNRTEIDKLTATIAKPAILSVLIERNLNKRNQEMLFEFLSHFESNLAVFVILECFQREKKEIWIKEFLAKLAVSCSGTNLMPLALFGLELPDRDAAIFFSGFRSTDEQKIGPLLVKWSEHNGVQTQLALLVTCEEHLGKIHQADRIVDQFSRGAGTAHREVINFAKNLAILIDKG